MQISYRPFCEFPGWEQAENYLLSIIQPNHCRSVLEAGSGANPTLQPETVHRYQLQYTTSDVSREEMEKADPTYSRLVLDLSAREVSPDLAGTFDCVVSRMVGEHIKDGEQYHRNIYKVLAPGGISVHYFASLGCLPFAVNRFMPDAMSDWLLNRFAPRDRFQHDKFRAYYSWGQGPTRNRIKGFEGLGFEVLQYIGYFGHSYYVRHLPWLHRLERLKSNILLKFPTPYLCSYATVVLRKPVK